MEDGEAASSRGQYHLGRVHITPIPAVRRSIWAFLVVTLPCLTNWGHSLFTVFTSTCPVHNLIERWDVQFGYI